MNKTKVLCSTWSSQLIDFNNRFCLHRSTRLREMIYVKCYDLHTHPSIRVYIISRWRYDVHDDIKPFTLSFYCLYICIFRCVCACYHHRSMLEGVFFSLFVLLIEMKKLWESAFSFAMHMYIDNPFSHIYIHIIIYGEFVISFKKNNNNIRFLFQ